MKRGFLSGGVPKPKPSASSTAPASSTSTTSSTSTSSTSPSPPGFYLTPSHRSPLVWSFNPPITSPTPQQTAHTAMHLSIPTTEAHQWFPNKTTKTRTTTIPNPPIWEVKEVKGKGLGVVATRDIPEGTVLWTESPIFVLDPDPQRGPKESEAEAVYRHAVKFLSPEIQATLLDLSNAFPASSLVGLLRTNAYPCITFGGESYLGVFEILSRVNHSCEPNVLVEWDESGVYANVRARTAIKQGDEVVTSWIMTMQKRDQRREELLIKYKFHCECPWCSLPDDESAKKDEEREAMAKAFLAHVSSQQK
ncbi:hypothetical protein MNV49_000731 [Pseudohyphozyma bogoriensis]|nr:hypothetical protein MNV49_000731 [Pseudohyphozyma bogoriensis]